MSRSQGSLYHTIAKNAKIEAKATLNHTIKTVKEIAKALGVPTAELFK